MKKILKILLVCLIAINFIFANQVNIKAAYEDLPWWYLQLDTTKGIYESEWMENSGSQILGTSLSEATAIKTYRILILHENLLPGAKLTLSMDLYVDGMRPTVTTWRFYNRVYNDYLETHEYLPINSPGDYAKSEQYNTDHDNWEWNYSIDQFEIVNNSKYTSNMLMIEFDYDEQQNLLFLMTNMKNLVIKVNPTEEQILQDTNNKVGGIFETVKNIFSGITELPNKIKDSLWSAFDMVKNAINNIQTWLQNLLDGIIQGLKNLFIPSDDYFKNYFDSLYDFFSEKLGILIMPLDILISLFENIMNLDNGDGYIHVPNFEFMGVNLITKTDYNLKVDVEKVLGNYYDMYYLLTDVIIYFMLFNMAKKKFETIVGGASE